jgi:hypothetical protein
MFATQRLAAVVAVVLVAAACGGEGGSPPPAPSSAETTAPVITAPPTLTPEEQAEADIQATFEELIAGMDEFYANASDYSVDEVSTDSPVTSWPVVDAAELELSNWVSAWRLSEVETVGSSVVTRHEVTAVTMNSATAAHAARSTACRDLSDIEFRDYLGEPADLPYEANRFQIWQLTWAYVPKALPEAGVDAPGWHVSTFEVRSDEPC